MPNDTIKLSNDITFGFIYDEKSRVVDNVTLEPNINSFIGMEMRKGGKFSYKIKRFNWDKVESLKWLPPIHRSGPKLERP